MKKRETERKGKCEKERERPFFFNNETIYYCWKWLPCIQRSLKNWPLYVGAPIKKKTRQRGTLKNMN